MQGEGYWLNADTLLEIDITSSHIKEIINDPDSFGLKKEYIESVYKKYGEILGIEAKARSEIIREAARNGWIRIRHYIRPGDYWSIQFDRWELRKGVIVNFVRTAMEKNTIWPDDTICLTGFWSGFYKELLVKEILHDPLRGPAPFRS
jgi:hypothetical protein